MSMMVLNDNKPRTVTDVRVELDQLRSTRQDNVRLQKEMLNTFSSLQSSYTQLHQYVTELEQQNAQLEAELKQWEAAP